MDVCKEYLTLSKANPSLSKRSFTLEREIRPTTIHDWIHSYIAYKDNNDNSNDGVKYFCGNLLFQQQVHPLQGHLLLIIMNVNLVIRNINIVFF